GTSESFDLKKLEYAIVQSLGDGENNDELRQILLDTVLERIKEKTTTSTHYINDIIETYLLRNKHYDVLQKYIDNRFEKNRIHSEKVNLLGIRLVTDPDHDRDELSDFSVNQIQIAANRYLQRDMETGDIVESMTGWFDRVASHVVLGSVVYDPSVYTKESQVGIAPKECNNHSKYDYSLSKTQEDVLSKLYIKLENNMIYDPLSFLQLCSELLRTDKYQSLYRKYFQYMYQGIFEPNTPTLMNAGTTNGKCSACFTLGVEDNMHSIMGLNSGSAYIFQGAGGLGTNISYIRPRGANIGTTFGAATGPIELVLEIIDFITQKVKSGGKRRGANMGLMEYWHPDIMEFINMKKKPGYLENFNISVMFDEDFWKHYHAGTDYDLRFDNKVYGQMSARNLIENIAVSAWSSAEPGVAFKDNANKANPLRTLKGDIKICNPCLTGDTRLATDKGLIRMDELYLSGKQLQIPTDNRTINGNPEEIGITLRSAVPVFKTSDGADVWEVETEHGYSVKATDYHPFYTSRGKIELKDLKIGEDDLWIQSDEGYFGNQGNYDTGLLLGLLESDGHIHKGKNRVVLQFNGEEKQTIIDKTLKIVNHILPKTKSSNGLQEIGVSEIPSRNTKLIQSTRLYTPIVEQLGYVKGQVPEIIWKGTRDCVIGYLQGLFGMDGHVDRNDRNSSCSIRLNQSNKQLLQEVQQLLGNFGIFCKLVLRREACEQLMPDGKGGQKMYKRLDNYELILYSDGRDKFINEIGFCLESKNKKALDFMKNHSSHKSKYNYTSKVKSITYLGKQPVYDTTVPVNHSLISNVLVTGNCAEQFMYDGESCTLGSINLAKLVREDGTFDWDGYVQIIHETTRFLNDVLEINQYPTEHIAEESDKSKRIGLGIMGLADLFFLLKIPYNSEYGFVIMEELSKTLYIESVKASIDLAEERGSCYWYKELAKVGEGSIEVVTRNYNDENEIQMALGTEYIQKLEQFGIRNMWTTTIAPTGTISMIADCSSGLEPIFSLVFSKITTAGKYYYTSDLFKKALIDAGIYSQQLIEKVEKNYGSCQGIEEIPRDIQNVFLTAMDLHWMDHVVAQSVWQNWIDNSISKTINMPYNVTVEDVKNAYILAHELGLKGIALFRDGSRNEQVLHVGSNVQSNKNEQNVQKDTPGTVTAPTKNQVERKIPPSPYGMNYIRDRVPEKLMVDLTLHAGKVVKYLEQGSECPSCKEMTLILESGCSSCKKCGYASCSVA
ncbi:MAG: LAGLIDADG family homing endonuclease, partial [Nitrososphaerales archaeon]